MQRRLAGLGYSPGPADGVFGPVTKQAVELFQADKELDVDGICGKDTWNSLVDAGYGLGDRLIYLTSPMLRGDDVAELQSRLAQLGFDPVRIDSVMGPDTANALMDFQANAGLAVDGICGPETLTLFRHLSPRAGTAGSTVSSIRERERVRLGPRGLVGRMIVVGEPGGLDAVAASLRRALGERGASVLTTHHPDWSVQADQANRLDADAFLALVSRGDERSVCYFGSQGVESAAGRELAAVLAEKLTPVLGTMQQRSMRLPILRETRMPAVVCRLGPVADLVPLSPAVARSVVESLETWLSLPAVVE